MDAPFNILWQASREGARGWGASHNSIVVDMGFEFNFNGEYYREVTIGTAGIVLFGNTSSTSSSNGFGNFSGPGLAPFWDDMRVSDGNGGACQYSSIEYATIESKGGNIFVVYYNGMALGSGGNGFYSGANFQVRLYEGTNKIEFYYDRLTGQSNSCNQWTSGTVTTSASIGIAADASNFLSVTPGSPATASRSTSNNSINVGGSPVASGTLYTFCPAGLDGNISQGGTAQMNDGDSLLAGKQVRMSSSQTYIPFTFYNQCASSFTYTITGPSAADYSITPSSGSFNGAESTPTIRFSPSTIGLRLATLKVEDNAKSIVRTFILAGRGIPRTTWTGNLVQGGTPTVANGDTLLKGIKVYNGQVGTFTPLTITVDNNPGPNAPITYTVVDPTGQFSVSPTSASVPPGGSSSPVIRFAPTGVGFQEAKLIVNAETEVRTYTLRAFASGSGANFYINGQPLVAGSSLFRNVVNCVGNGSVTTIPIEVRSIGDEPFKILSSDAYIADISVTQGTPPYPLKRDDFGNLIPAPDYFISDAAGNPLSLPITVQPGQNLVIYLGFVPTRPDMRRARTFFETNGLNYFGLDVNNQRVQGNLNFELVGTGRGSRLSNATKTGLPSSVVMPQTEIRDTSYATGWVYNKGECDLLVDADEFRLVSGDVREFKLFNVFPNHVANADRKYAIKPGDSASFDVQFVPSRSGSRVASVRVVSNDSLVYIDGVTELGTYYIDLYGYGKVGLEGRDLTLAPAVIDGPSSTGSFEVENNAGGVVSITNIQLVGSPEFAEDPANPWPALPFVVEPGKKLKLGVIFTPATGSAPGERTAEIEVTLNNGDVLTLTVKALAGTRSLVIVPTSLFQGMKVQVGDLVRQYFAISNSGTFPVRLTSMQLSGPNAAAYTVSPIVRATVQPGGTEFFEVTYSPQAIGASSATLTIVTNSINGTPAGTHVVTLGGEGMTTVPNGGGSESTTPGENPAIRPSLGVTGWAAQLESGEALWQSNPNPSSDRIEIRYWLPVQERVSLELYNSRGEQIRSLEEGLRGEGSHTVGAEVRDLPSGRYYYMLRSNSGSLTLSLEVVR